MSTLQMPDITAGNMPIVPTVRIRSLMAKRQSLLREAELIQDEIDRLAVIEQRKVFSRFKRDIGERAIAEYLHATTAGEPVSVEALRIECAAREASDAQDYPNVDFEFSKGESA